MSEGRHKNLWKTIKAVIVILIGIPLLITLVRYAAWKMVLYLAFWILAPGAITARYVFRRRYEDWETGVLSAFFIGAGLIFAEWFLLQLLHVRWPILVINPGIVILFALFLFCYKKEGVRLLQSVRGHVHLTVPFLLTLFAAVYLCAYYLNFSMPRAVDIGSTDCTWQVGNINQLAGKTPFNDIRVDGVTAKYHFFARLFLAIAKYIFGGEGWIYLVQYPIWYLPLLITIAFRKLYQRVACDESLITTAAIATMAGFFLNSSYGPWQIHLFTDINSVGLGIPCLLLLFLNLTEERKNSAFLLEQLLLLFVLTGTKGPFAMLYVLALLVWVPLCAVKRKKWDAGGAVLAVTSAVFFALIFYFLLSAGTETYFSGLGRDDVLQSAIRGSELRALYERMGAGGMRSRFLFLLPSLIASFTWLLPFVIWGLGDLAVCFFGKKKAAEDTLFAAILVGGGLTAYYLFHVMGNSELYFLFAAIPFMGYIGFQKMYFLLKTERTKKVVCIAIFAAAFLQLYGNLLWGSGNLPGKTKGYLLHTAEAVEADRLAEFQAYDFLRENTPADALIATNQQGGGTFHNISAFAERQCYLEGSEYSRRNFGFQDGELRQQQMWDLFGNEWDEETKADFCRWTGIDYLVIFRKIEAPAQVPSNTSEYFEPIYENGVIAVYQVHVE